jgi:uncharacterized protein (DUF4415 family)
MTKWRPKPEMPDDENPELTADDFARMRPAREALPPELVAVLPARRRGERGPGRAPKGQQRTVRLWPEVAAAFPTGEGSNDRINEALLAFVQSQKPIGPASRVQHRRVSGDAAMSHKSAKRKATSKRSGGAPTSRKTKKVA